MLLHRIAHHAATISRRFSGPDPPRACAQVITQGLGRTELNGCRGTVQPRSTWTNNRVTVLLAAPVGETASISVKRSRLTLVQTGTGTTASTSACWVCLETEAESAEPLLDGCACRGTSG